MAIEKISIDGMERLSVDTADGRLFWDGKEIVTAMALPWWVQVAAVVTAASTAVLAIAAVAQLLTA